MCVKVKDYVSKAMDQPNIMFFCDECVPAVIQCFKSKRKLTSIESKAEEILEKATACLKAVQSSVSLRGESPVSSWSEVVKKYNPPLIIKPKDRAQNSQATKKWVTENVDPKQIGANVNKILPSNEGSVRILCDDEESTKKLQKIIITNKFADKYDTKVLEMKKPKIVVVGLSSETVQDVDSFVRAVQARIPNIYQQEIKLIKTYVPKGKKRHNVIFETSAEAQKFLIELGRVSQGWESYPIYEFVSVLRCFKCWKYGHMSNMCTRLEHVCPLCGDEHKQDECKSNVKVCANCKHAKEVLHIPGIDYNHTIFDRACSCYQREKEKIKNQTFSK